MGAESLPIAHWSERENPDLTWALLSPSLLRYSYLDDLADNPDFVARQEDNVPSTELIPHRIATCKVRLAGRCKGLFEFRPYGLEESRPTHQEIVRFTHRSIPEFLEEYLSSHWKKFLSEFDFVNAYIRTLMATLKLFKLDSSILIANRIEAELLCTLQVVRNSQNGAKAEYFTYLDDLEALLYAKQIEGSPEFPRLTWTHFYSSPVSSPTFLSVFHTALGACYHEYAAWKTRINPEVIANGNAAEALINVLNGIRFHRLIPLDLFPCMCTPSNVFSTVLALLQQGVNPTSISIRPKDCGLSAWGYLVALLTCRKDHIERDGYWAAVEVCLQFGTSLPTWSRNSEKSLSISLAEMSNSIDALSPGMFTPGSDIELLMIPGVLRQIGGTATLVDFVSLHAPPNAERILEILEARERQGGVA